jgi:hypothetical protein
MAEWGKKALNAVMGLFGAAGPEVCGRVVVTVRVGRSDKEKARIRARNGS